MTAAVLGIIGGSGIYDLPGLANVVERRIESPWGEPSGAAAHRRDRRPAGGVPAAARQGPPRCRRPTSTIAPISTCSSAPASPTSSRCRPAARSRRSCRPGTFVLVDQFVDRTHKRESSFFGKGCVAHVSMAHPVSPRLRIHIAEAAMAEDIAVVARRHLCLHGGAAVLDARRKPDLQESRLCGDRHDQHAGGQARARGRDLLRHRRHGHAISIAGIPTTTP